MPEKYCLIGRVEYGCNWLLPADTENWKNGGVAEVRSLRRLGPRVGLAGGVLCIGFSAIFVRLAAAPGVVSAFYRVCIASLVLFPIWLVRGSRFDDRRTLFYSVLAGVFFGLDLALWNVSVLLTSAANATVLAYLAPVWVGLAALFFFREKIKRSYWPGTAMALVGMIIILGLENVSAFRFGRGNILAVVSSFFYAGYLLTAQVARRRADTLLFTAVSIFSCTILLLLISLFRGEKLTGYAPPTWLAFLGLGLISHLGGWYAINSALGQIRASVVSVSLLGQPLVTALAAAAILGEPLRMHQAAGGLLILAGVYIVHRA
jgi:drug/metabolite transporter (DMT)-like permease